VRHIGNGDDQAPPATGRFSVNGIVEIPCVVAIDRDQGQPTKILAPLLIGFEHVITQ